MNYEKAYKEALERAKNLHKDAIDMDENIRAKLCEIIFPELNESEDEKIRKWLIDTIKSVPNDSIEWDVINKSDVLAWLEKQGEQNIADKAESKFHEGDWVILTAGELSTILQIVKVATKKKLYWFNDSSYLPIVDEECLRLWSIQDAKDGDVVVDESDGTIGIFQSIGHHPDGGSYNDPSYCFLHCRYDNGFFYADFEYGNTMNSDDVIPATKEQRELLFAKMKEAGYEWDADTKELKKIVTNGGDFCESENCGQKPTWSEEDERIRKEIISIVKSYRECCITEGNHRFDDCIAWLEKQGEQNQG